VTPAVFEVIAQQMQTLDNRKSREKLLKSEALLTLSLQTHFSLEANSAPSLHRDGRKFGVNFFALARCSRRRSWTDLLGVTSRDLTARRNGRRVTEIAPRPSVLAAPLGSVR
jgi:hypothetical protein